MSVIPTKPIELMLAGWDESHSSGRKVTFWISDEDEFQYFKNATVRKGKVAGQRYQTVFVQLSDDETPDQESLKPAPVVQASVGQRSIGLVDEKAPAKRTDAQRAANNGLCGLSLKWCKDPHFQEWCLHTFGDAWAAAGDVSFEKAAAFVVRRVCGATASRTELDTKPEAGALFKIWFMGPYKAQRAADKIDE